MSHTELERSLMTHRKSSKFKGQMCAVTFALVDLCPLRRWNKYKDSLVFCNDTEASCLHFSSVICSISFFVLESGNIFIDEIKRFQ